MVQACEACEACEGVDWAHFLQVAFQVLDSNGKNTEPIGPSGPSGPGSTIRLASKIMIVAAPVLILAAFVLASFHTSKRLEHEEKPERGMSFGMLILLASTLCLDFFCTDQYQPSMPDMAKEFGVSDVAMGATIQIHLFTSAVCMLFLGPLSDFIGRRIIILCCQVLLVASTFCCACADTFVWFVIGRVFQGVAAAVAPVVLAAIPDCVTSMEDRLWHQAVLTRVMMLGPILAPSGGGFLANIAGWRCPFFLLSGLSAVVLVCSFWTLEETAPSQHLAQNYLTCASRILLQKSRLMLLVACIAGKSFWDLLAASNGFTLRQHFHLSIWHASICITLMAIAGFVGSLVPSWLPCGPMRAIRGSLLPLFLVTAAMVCLAWGETNSSTGLTGLTSFLVSICFVQLILYTPFISSVCQFTCGVEDIAGVASSLLSSIVYLGSSLVSLELVVLVHHSDNSASDSFADVADSNISSLMLALAATLLVVTLSLAPLSCTDAEINSDSNL